MAQQVLCPPAAEGNGTMYRHSKTGETTYKSLGQPLPERGVGRWFAWTHDNPTPMGNQPILIGRGLIAVSEGGMIDVGNVINIYFDVCDSLRREDWPQVGQFKVISVRSTTYRGKGGIHIEVELYLSQIDETKLVHLATSVTC